MIVGDLNPCRRGTLGARAPRDSRSNNLLERTSPVTAKMQPSGVAMLAEPRILCQMSRVGIPLNCKQQTSSLRVARDLL